MRSRDSAKVARTDGAIDSARQVQILKNRAMGSNIAFV